MQAQRLDDGEGMEYLWEDIADVTVPAKTKRKTVIAKALLENPGVIEGGKAVIRVIPAEHAEPIKVEMEQPPPQLKIG